MFTNLIFYTNTVTSSTYPHRLEHTCVAQLSEDDIIIKVVWNLQITNFQTIQRNYYLFQKTQCSLKIPIIVVVFQREF